DREVRVREDPKPLARSQERRFDRRDRVRRADGSQDVAHRLRVMREPAAQIEERRRAEEQRRDEQARARHPLEPRRECVARRQFDLILPASEKIGRYIAMSTVPTTLPMPTIMNGSIKLVSAATATSTSSS